MHLVFLIIIKHMSTRSRRAGIAALIILIVYFLIEGSGLFANTYNIVAANLKPGTQVTPEAAAIVRNMYRENISRVLLLAIALFPIIFISIKYHIKFQIKDGSIFKKVIPFIRVIAGAVLFYIILNSGTQFLHELFTNYYSLGYWPSYLRIVAAFAVFGGSIIDLKAAMDWVKKFPQTHPKLYKVIFVIGISVCSCCILELQVASKMNMMTHMIFFSVLYWILLQVFFYVLTNNLKIGAFVSLGLSYLIGLINDVVYQFRGNYVMFGDLTVVRTALEVAGNYTYKPKFWFFVCLALLAMGVLITIFIKLPRGNKPTGKGIAMRAAIEAVLIAAVIITFKTGILYNNVFGVGWDYNKNIIYTGYLPYFLSNMNSIRTVNVDGYDPALADDALENVNYEEETDTNFYPNIIIIQNEAFSDLSVAYDIETNQDYMPFVRSLTENTRKGYLNMSITGGPTANTEFEILLRSTLCYLPYGSVPYTQYVNSDLPSIVQVLRGQSDPYYTVAYHPYYSSGYRRPEVYDHFGFDEVVFEDHFQSDFSESDLIRDYLSDSADYERVEELYEQFRSHSDAPWFCFNVTIQNHGGYTQDYDPEEEDRVYVTNFEATDSINSYLSLVKVSDDAFRELIEYFEQCDEPTIIAMYGDHQPAFDEEATNLLGEHAVAASGGDGNYYVPYVIWANFDIEEENTLGDADTPSVMNTLSTNYFASVVFETAGIELTDYDRYLLSLHEDIPAITALGVWDSNGNHYPSPGESPYADELSDLEMIQYNLIFDDEHRLTDRFE